MEGTAVRLSRTWLDGRPYPALAAASHPLPTLSRVRFILAYPGGRGLECVSNLRCSPDVRPARRPQWRRAVRAVRPGRRSPQVGPLGLVKEVPGTVLKP